MNREEIRRQIEAGRAVLGLELGSTRIKAVLIDESRNPAAVGAAGWENRFENGIWTYSLDDVWAGIRASYADLCRDVREKYGCEITRLKAMGFSAMMHGYLPFGKDGTLLVPYRTWRNTMTSRAAKELTKRFRFNVPQRWSVAHLYESVLNDEPHAAEIDFLTTLSGYVHWQVSGRRVLGIGDASGMFPIDDRTGDYDEEMLRIFRELIAHKGYPWDLRDILPQVLRAGEPAGELTERGAALIDPTGRLEPGIPLAPPEGDAGTGMTATAAVAPGTGNVSAGTSIFAMIVLEKPLSDVYEEADIVTTPAGRPVAMVHCNNGTSDTDAWARMLAGFAESLGHPCAFSDALEAIFREAVRGDADCGGLVSYNFLAGEHIAGLEEGRPLFVRLPGAAFTFANFARALLFGTLATLKYGMDLLTNRENLNIRYLLGHGGFFKTDDVGQRFLASALNIPVRVNRSAGEGGPWGMALLAAYMADRGPGESLEDFLDRVFADVPGTLAEPNPQDVRGFAAYMERFRAGLAAEEAAVRHLRS